MSALDRIAEGIAMRALRTLGAETAHAAALRLLAARHAAGLGAGPAADRFPRLAGTVMGLAFPNPVGIAAGFDKNAVAVPAALAVGAGFVEIGAVTPRPQAGNPRPRLFRLPQDRAIINRFGFNNLGMEVVAANLARARPGGIVGVNLGANKDSADRAQDYATVLARFAGLADFFTVNVSSPNTERLRDLQGADALSEVLRRSLAARDAHAPGKPLLVKIAPDLDPAGLEAAVGVCLACSIDGIVATNTTLARGGLRSPRRTEAGGLSGRPLMARSTEVVRDLARLTGGRMPLVGVGGIASAEDAYAKVRAGARLVQLYTGLVYHGLSLIPAIADGLDRLLARDGFSHIDEAVGADA